MRRTLISICVLQAFSPFAWAEQVPAENTSIELQATNVTATADLESAQGPVQGYHCLLYTSPSPRD